MFWKLQSSKKKRQKKKYPGVGQPSDVLAVGSGRFKKLVIWVGAETSADSSSDDRHLEKLKNTEMQNPPTRKPPTSTPDRAEQI